MNLLNDAQKADLKSKLKKLQDDYASSIPEKLTEISDHWEQYQSQKDEASIDQLINCVHKLAGTAKTYGFAELGMLAGNAEDELICFQEQPLSDRKNLAPSESIEKLLNYR
ncbi:Hpt domain-containing protein [Thalassospira australica]|uniref:Hpt domain-containing protein n=1 Tax=Thalassospira australica TaxID=1528106 RepID=UPI00051A0536|nr:Hpt domain-containing protein [Thalassospira australica]